MREDALRCVRGDVLLTSIICSAIATVSGIIFSPEYHIIHTVACTTYQWSTPAGGSIILDSVKNKRTVCTKSVFSTNVSSAYQDRLNCTILSDGSEITVKFCFSSITRNDSGVYTLKTADQESNGTIFVMDKPTTPQISPTTVEAGRQKTLSCTSTSTSTPSPTGQALYYTWTVNNAAISDPRYSTSGNTLSINTVRREDKDSLFQCTARENQGLSSDTTGIHLTVHYPPQGKPVMSYSSLTYVTDSTVTLSCSITEDGNPQATWTWRCGRRTFNSGITNSTGRSNLTFVATKADNIQPCTCTASSSVGLYSQTSDPATLDIRYPPQGKPMMTYSTLVYVSGTSVTLSCSITDDGNPQAMWTWRCGSRTFNSGIINSVRRSNLTFVVAKTDNNQPCTCTASSSVGPYSQMSDPATLDIKYPPQGKPVMTYSTLTYITGGTVTLSCSITEDGNPQATWAWQCGSRTFNSGITNSAGRSNLTFVSTKTDNNQPCTCTASSSVGSYSQTSDSATLNIRYPPQGKPVMTYSTLTYLTGTTVTLSCSITEEGNPQATWAWQCGSRTLNSGITNSTGRSNLTFVVTKTDNNQPCTCTASSSVGSYSQTSDPATLDIRYPPEGRPRFINSVLIHNESNAVSFTCSLTSNGNPPVSWIWTIGARNFTSGYITNTGSQSTLQFQISKTENNKICRCRAVSSQVSYNEFKEVLLDVRYPSTILSLVPSNQTIIENQILSVAALVEGNPFPDIKWINDDNKTTLMTNNTNSNNSVLRFDQINCLDTATYKVMAYNGYGDMDSRSINISVLCPPRPLHASKFPQRVAVEDEKKLNVSFVSVGNPMPIVKWYFRKNQTSNNITLEMSKILTETKAIGKVLYQTILKRNLTSEDFGEYFAELKNKQGNVAIIFKVVSKGRPDPPTDLAIHCSPLTARLYWVSQFNGLGEMEEQQFNLLYKINGTGNFSVNKKILTDVGWGKNLTGSVTLSPGVWIFKIEAQNSIGRTESDANISCKVEDVKNDSSSGSLPVAGVAGGVVAFIIIIVLAVVIVLFLRKKGMYAKKDSQYSSHKGPLVDNNFVDDGIKDNVLYQSADEAVGKANISDNPSNLYAEVQKRAKKKNQSDGPTSLYAEVQKQGKKGKKGMKGKQKQSADGGMVYENVEPKLKQETSFSNNTPRGQTNQDGLLYVDVDIKPRADGKRGVIIGEEDRTDYASVDFVFPVKKENE